MRNPIDAATDAFRAMVAAFADAKPAPRNRVARRAQRGPHQSGWNHRNFKTAPFKFTDAERCRIAKEGNPR